MSPKTTILLYGPPPGVEATAVVPAEVTKALKEYFRTLLHFLGALEAFLLFAWHDGAPKSKFCAVLKRTALYLFETACSP